jgi:CDP-glucose 4,6-dehydratase
MPVRTCYQGKRVLITGLTGFKGIWLGLWLEQLGATVQGLALSPTEPMRLGWPGLEKRLPCLHGDIRDPSIVQGAFKKFQPDIVFHLAAQPLVRLSYTDPIGTYETNVMGTAHVLESARQSDSAQATIVITTDKCYENREWHWGYREVDPVGGHDPYSSSKACSEILAASYRRSFPDHPACRRLATARAGNVIGGGDWAEDRLVPDMVRALLAEKPIHLRRPAALRPWQHVLEPLSGYLLLGAALLDNLTEAAAAWNFGPIDVEPLMVRDIAHQFVKTWGRGLVTEENTETGPHEAHFLKLDSSKAVMQLGWQPLLNSSERLAWTVDWYKSWQDSPDRIWDQTLEQIQQAEEKIARLKLFSDAWVGRPASRTKAA